MKRREKRENTSHSSPLWRRHRTEQLRFRIPAAAFAGQNHAEKFAVATSWQRPRSSSLWRPAPVVNQRLCPETEIVNVGYHSFGTLGSFLWCLLSPKDISSGVFFQFLSSIRPS